MKTAVCFNDRSSRSCSSPSLSSMKEMSPSLNNKNDIFEAKLTLTSSSSSIDHSGKGSRFHVQQLSIPPSSKSPTPIASIESSSSSSSSIHTSSSYFSLNSNLSSSSVSCETCSLVNVSPFPQKEMEKMINNENSIAYEDIGYFNFYSFPLKLWDKEQLKNLQQNQNQNFLTKEEFDNYIENIFHGFSALFWRDLPDLDSIIPQNDLRNHGPNESFITSSSISQYLCLLQQLIQSTNDKNLQDEKQVCKRIDSFLNKLLFDNEDIITMLISPLTKISIAGAMNEISNFYFANVIRMNLFYSDMNNIEIPINNQEIINIVNWLYPEYNLPKLFRFIETAKNKISDAIIKSYDSHNDNIVNNIVDDDYDDDDHRDNHGEKREQSANAHQSVLNAYFESQSHFIQLPVLDKLFIFLFDPNFQSKLTATKNANKDQQQRQLEEEENESFYTDKETVNKSLIVFCLRSSLFEQVLGYFKKFLEKYHPHLLPNSKKSEQQPSSNGNDSSSSSSTTTAKNVDIGNSKTIDDYDDDTAQIMDGNFDGSPSLLSSPYLVKEIYKFAILLALIGSSSFDLPELVNQLLTIRVADLSFENFLKHIIDVINLELRSIDEDRIINDHIDLEPFDLQSLSDTEFRSSSSHSAAEANPSNELARVITLRQKRQLIEKIRMQGNNLMAHSNNMWSFNECIVCYESKWLLIRSRCSHGACLDCLTRYYTNQIKTGILSIECIGPGCKEYVYRTEVFARLIPDDKALYGRLLLMKSSESDRCKPCPRCNKIFTLSQKQQAKMKRATKKLMIKRFIMFGFNQSLINQSKSFKVKCEACEYDWCFKCHSPWHEGLSCNDYVKGDALLKSWAKQDSYKGDVNAQKCPRCKIYIQRISGCDHMHCTRCNTDFCYRCGDRIRQLRFFGDHYSRLSVLGCKYRYEPENPIRRKFVRGAVLGSKLMVLPLITTVCLCTGALVLAVGVAAMPFVGGVYFFNQIRNQRHRSFPRIYNHPLNNHLREHRFLNQFGRFNMDQNTGTELDVPQTPPPDFNVPVIIDSDGRPIAVISPLDFVEVEYGEDDDDCDGDNLDNKDQEDFHEDRQHNDDHYGHHHDIENELFHHSDNLDQ